MSTIPAPDPGSTIPRVDILPGQVLMNRYEVVRVLGRGAMGEVLEVRDRTSGLGYALKRVPPELVRDATQMKSIQANFALVSQLAHPHIATTRHLEIDTTTGHAYLILELVHGTDMHLWLAERRAALGGPNAPLPIPEILGVAEQIASALDYAHAQPVSRGPDGRPSRYGLLHRDLKPANVMVETARDFRPGIPYVKLVDFGLAAEIQASLHEHSIDRRRENAAGTLLYMAPEQWEGRTLTRGVDQWAFAVVLYDMAAGRKPFIAASSEALFMQVKRADPEKPATLSPAQWEVFKKAFNPDRRGRFRSCMAFVKALAAADTRTEGSVISAEMPMPDEFHGVPSSGPPLQVPVPETQVPNAPKPRSPVVPLALLATVVALVMAVVVFTGWFTQPGKNQPLPSPPPQPVPAPAPTPGPAPAPTPDPAPKQAGGPVWKPLRLVWEDRPSFEVWISGTALRNEGAARTGMAPVGGWIELQEPGGQGQIFHELRWEGQPEIHLRKLGQTIEWSLPGGAWNPLSVDERNTENVGELGLENQPDLTVSSMLIQHPGVPGMLALMKALRPTAVTCLLDDREEFLAEVPSLRRVSIITPARITQKTLWKMKQLSAVELGKSDLPVSIEGIEECAQLETLILANCTQAASLAPIASLKHLRELMLPPQATGKDLRGWRENGVLDGLIYLAVNGCVGIDDLSFLRGLKHLSGLDLSDCRNVLELDALETLPPLRYLGLPPNSTNADLERLRKHGSFEKLVLLVLNAKNLENLGALDGLPELSALTLSQTEKLSDLSALKSLSNLRELRLYGMLPVQAFDHLADLRRLRLLILPSSCNDELLQRLQSAGCLDHLVSLDVSACSQLTDERPLTKLANLRQLNLTDCKGLFAAERLANLRASLPQCELVGAPEPAAVAPPAAEEATLPAPVAFVLQQIPVAVGTHLKKGDPIGQLTGTVLKMEWETAKARVEAAKANAAQANLEFERAKRLLEGAVIPQADFDKATAAKNAADAAVTLARKEAELLDQAIRNGGLTMPFDGVIVKYHLQVGELAKIGEPFVTVRKDP